MNQNLYRIIASGSMLLGIGLWVGFSLHLDNGKKLDCELNPASVKGSPYGKVFALAMQGPIDLYWHFGETHESAELLNAEHTHPDGTSHSHEDGLDHGYGEGASTVERSVILTPDESNKAVEDGGVKVFTKQVKDEFKLMGATAKRKTDGTPLSSVHRRYIQSVIEDKVRLAYELDPTNYTNYGNLHLFLSVNDLGGSAADAKQAQNLAVKTLAICKKDEVDPSSWVTAASAAYNIIYHIGLYHNEYTVEEAKSSLKDFDDCIARYEVLLESAIQEGRIVSETRFLELEERVRFLRKIRKAQGVYMKRMMSGRAADNKPFKSFNN